MSFCRVFPRDFLTSYASKIQRLSYIKEHLRANSDFIYSIKGEKSTGKKEGEIAFECQDNIMKTVKYYSIESSARVARFDVKWPDPSLIMSITHYREDPIEWPNIPPAAILVYDNRFPDLAYFLDGVLCISDHVWEELGPHFWGHRTHRYPVTVPYDGQEHRFWALFFPKVSCLDQERSVRKNDLYITRVIDSSRIPSDTPCLRPAEMTNQQLVRDDIRREIKRRKYIGLDFIPVLQSNDDDLPTPDDFNLDY